MLILNGVVHPMDGPVIPRGFVAFEGEKLTAVGPMEALPAGAEGPVLDARGGISCPASSTPTATWACSGMPWALRRTTETSPPTPVPPSSGPSTG
ncbi:hypothetical protein HMPREF0995_02980 [Lachnospiraceae bacterium 7_1_58FAA]|nr:hypothetical protein HMPREF0995_02980 [Lachnospiraceae bacterium 7_1_58FAA]